MEKILGIEILVSLCMILVSHVIEADPKPFLINCGVVSVENVDGRRWVGDSTPLNTNMTLSSLGVSGSTSSFSGDEMYESLYKTARFFVETMNYTFRVESGNYYVRLHFYPFSFEGHAVDDSLFSIWGNDLKLVSDFRVSDEILNTKRVYLVKEYFVTVVDSGGLVIKFVPDYGNFAFVNAIEVIPVIDELFVDSGTKVGGNGGVRNSWINLGQGMETIYRMNVGGPVIEANSDQPLWRKWVSDEDYMFTSYAGEVIKNSSSITYSSVNDTSIAPILVYETARIMANNQVLEKRFNMSWKFYVDPGFDYLVRLHFCELVYEKRSQRIFRIYINNRTAAENFDVYARAGGMEKAYHQDYVDVVSSEVNTLWVQLGPDTAAGAYGTDALLNGLEIFKVSRNGNLARMNVVEGLHRKEGSRRTTMKGRVLWEGIGAGIASIAVLGALCAFLFCYCAHRKKMLSQKDHRTPVWCSLFQHESSHGTSNASTARGCTLNANGISSRIGRRFTLLELQTATNSFDESLVIGVGGFGKVYKGEIDDISLVAIKRANPQSEQGLAEFETEIEMLSKLRHRHLVSMIGFCEEQNEMILVYEYMAKGTLRSHLFGTDFQPLTWKQRLDICIGSARGLHYLHTGAERGIIHRDVKTTNILLDESFVAKVADFGLSKTGPALDHTHVSTAVKGSFGYLDPEYFRRQQLTEKSDVYSFGVVLFEVICARPVINPSLPKDQINLAEWAIQWQRKGLLESIVDPKLQGSYTLESLKKFGEIAEKCLADEGRNRPTMGEVLWHLEYVLQLHEAAVRSNNTGDDSFSSDSSKCNTARGL